MIRCALLSLIVLACGCTNHTAAIAHSAIDARQALGSAIVHVDAARRDLDTLQASVDEVSMHVAFVSDDENPIYATLQYVSVAAIVIGGAAALYTFRNWIPIP